MIVNLYNLEVKDTCSSQKNIVFAREYYQCNSEQYNATNLFCSYFSSPQWRYPKLRQIGIHSIFAHCNHTNLQCSKKC